MLSQRIGSLLPPLSEQERLECGIIHSAAGLPIEKILQGIRPFRSPHYTVSEVGLIGGGSTIRPGEISLAHCGTLFLDEFPEFRRQAIEALRLPLESGDVKISRAKGSLTLPAQFQLLTAMNPCPCGRFGNGEARCTCSSVEIQRYLKQLSQPILDRIDMHVEMQAVSIDTLASEKPRTPAPSDIIRKVLDARTRQMERQEALNAYHTHTSLDSLASTQGKHLLLKAAKQRGYSIRALNKILRVARTISDLEGSDEVQDVHVAEALSLRALDRLAVHLGMERGVEMRG